MMQKKFHVLALCSLALLAGCAKNGAVSTSQTPEQIVQQRATERWNLMIARDFDKVYEYTDTAYRLVNTPIDLDRKYGGKRYRVGVNWTKAEFISVECGTPDRCVTRFSVSSLVNVPPSFTNMEINNVPTEEVWLLQEGNWFYYMN